MSDRHITRRIRGTDTSDGAGVKLKRVIGQAGLDMLDPFLLLDEFRSDQAGDYIAGFPEHPHRGFETVTYMLAGHMQHQDNHGNRGDLSPGSVQWMTAGRGILHSEMPEQEDGLMWGFQLWVNLPAKDKMTAPRYQDIGPERIPVVHPAAGVEVKVIAGESLGRSARIDTRVPIQMLHFTIQPGGAVAQPVPVGQNGLIYVFKGTARIGSERREVREGQAALLESGESVELAVDADARSEAELLLLSGKPLNEPVARYGPFVMNTPEQIEQAFSDYQSGRFGVIPQRS